MFKIPDLSKLENLRSIRLDQLLMVAFPKLPATVQKLDLSANYRMDFWSLESCQNLQACNLLGLESLALRSVPYITGESLMVLLNPSKGKLKELDISGCGGIDKTAVDTLITGEYLDGIEDLNLSKLDIDDSVAEALARSAPKLKRLDLSSTDITGVGVKALALKPQSTFAELTINSCVGVSIDAVEFAKSKGIKVTFTFPDNLRYGKRVRLG